jgi:hypothetical protein
MVPGFRLSADYTHIQKRDEIVDFLGLDYILGSQHLFSDRITRVDRQPSDPSNWPGPISSLDVSAINLAKSSSSYWDLQADYTRNVADSGTLRVYAVGTLAESYTRRILPDQPEFEFVGSADDGSPLRFRGNFGATLEKGLLSLDWNVQYYSRYRVTYSDPNIATLNPGRIALQGRVVIPSQVYHDFALKYALSGLGGSKLGSSEILFGIQNAFNKRPPVMTVSQGQLAGFKPIGYSPYGDPRLRRFTLGVRTRFGASR